MPRTIATIVCFAAATFIALPAMAEEMRVTKASNSDELNIVGTVGSVTDESFTLVDAQNRLTIEMDGQRWASGDLLEPGDRVSVTGRLGADFVNTQMVEASAISIPRFANPGDEDADWIALNGTVETIADGQLTMLAGARSVTVDTHLIGADPGVAAATAGLAVGDRISVAGTLPPAQATAMGPQLRASSIALLDAGAV